MEFSKTLARIKSAKKFTSARECYDYLLRFGELPFNYSYFTRMENGKALPSKGVVSQLGKIFPEFKKDLILSWCADSFPEQTDLFSISKQVIQQKLTVKPQFSQSILSELQADTIVISQEHYFVFLIFTLAREQLTIDQIESFFNFDTKKIIADFLGVRIIRQEGERFIANSIESRMPDSDSERGKLRLQKIRDWNANLAVFSNFAEIKKRFFVRRTSERQIQLLISFLESLDQLVRVSDESDFSLNKEVFIFQYSLSNGRMPG